MNGTQLHKSRDFGQQQGYTYRNKKKQWKKQVGDDVTLVPDGPGRLGIDLFPSASTHMYSTYSFTTAAART